MGRALLLAILVWLVGYVGLMHNVSAVNSPWAMNGEGAVLSAYLPTVSRLCKALDILVNFLPRTHQVWRRERAFVEAQDDACQSHLFPLLARVGQP